jgi:hypothetical protein
MLRIIRKRFYFSIVTSGAIIALAAFQWKIIDAITPFLFLPLAAVLGVLFLISAGTGVSCFWKLREIKHIAFAPFAINVFALLIVYFVPFTKISTDIDFKMNKKHREEIVAKVYKGELKNNISHNISLIALGASYPSVSAGGNEIVVEEHDGKKYVFFYLYRGVLDNYSGFLHVPEGGDPQKFGDLNESKVTQIIPYDDRWFYASHH